MRGRDGSRDAHGVTDLGAQGVDALGAPGDAVAQASGLVAELGELLLLRGELIVCSDLARTGGGLDQAGVGTKARLADAEACAILDRLEVVHHLGLRVDLQRQIGQLALEGVTFSDQLVAIVTDLLQLGREVGRGAIADVFLVALDDRAQLGRDLRVIGVGEADGGDSVRGAEQLERRFDLLGVVGVEQEGLAGDVLEVGRDGVPAAARDRGNGLGQCVGREALHEAGGDEAAQERLLVHLFDVRLELVFAEDRLAVLLVQPAEPARGGTEAGEGLTRLGLDLLERLQEEVLHFRHEHSNGGGRGDGDVVVGDVGQLGAEREGEEEGMHGELRVEGAGCEGIIAAQKRGIFCRFCRGVQLQNARRSRRLSPIWFPWSAFAIFALLPILIMGSPRCRTVFWRLRARWRVEK